MSSASATAGARPLRLRPAAGRWRRSMPQLVRYAIPPFSSARGTGGTACGLGVVAASTETLPPCTKSRPFVPCGARPGFSPPPRQGDTAPIHAKLAWGRACRAARIRGVRAWIRSSWAQARSSKCFCNCGTPRACCSALRSAGRGGSRPTRPCSGRTACGCVWAVVCGAVRDCVLSRNPQNPGPQHCPPARRQVTACLQLAH
jgi:hypothetical protein